MSTTLSKVSGIVKTDGTIFGRFNHKMTTLVQAGVPILAGTDAPNPGTTHGASLHHELELLTIAGLSNKQALTGATSRAADSFQLIDRGRIRDGLRGDLLLVRGNPLEDIKTSRDIVRICKAGHPIDRDKRKEKIRKATERKKQADTQQDN